MGSLKALDTRAPESFDKAATKETTAGLIKRLQELQNLLYAEGKHSVLVLFQGMDASGKDGIIRNVLGRVNPQGVQVTSFKTPTEEEAAHDFLWRIHRHVPAKGMIQVFNRSHYEDVLITRVHGWCDKETAHKRFKAINHFERLLVQHNNTVLLKCYLHLSPGEQQERLQERIDDPTKHWKHNSKDFDEAKLWDQYMEMYEEVFTHCNEVPWHFIPADQNWYKEYTVAKLLVDALEDLQMQFPKLEK